MYLKFCILYKKYFKFINIIFLFFLNLFLIEQTRKLINIGKIRVFNELKQFYSLIYYYLYGMYTTLKE